MQYNDDLMSILQALNDRIKDTIHVCDIAKVLKVDGRNAQCQLVNEPEANIMAYIPNNIEVNVNDIVVVIYTDKDSRANLKNIETSNPFNEVKVKVRHSIDYGVIVLNFNQSSGGSISDIKVNGSSIVVDNIANLLTEGNYSSSNKLATMNDLPTITTITKTILSTDWIADNTISPFVCKATITQTISNNDVIRLINNDAILFGTYGFSIYSISANSIVIVAIDTPSNDVSLLFEIRSE